MKRPILKLVVPLLILALVISAAAVLPATSQNKEAIIDKLDELHDKLEGQKALQNKVNAVIHQIEAGAFHGAINKLENDVKKSILARVENPEELIALVNEIINLIKGIEPPKPTTPDFEITAEPDELEIMQGNWKTSTITITSLNNFTQIVNLTVTSASIENVTTILTPSQVAPPANASVTALLNVTVGMEAKPDDYMITVTGTSDTLSHSVDIELEIEESQSEKDTTPPTIVSVLRSPETPAYNETVTITAFVYDAGSGIKQVVLTYTGGSGWTSVIMTLSMGLYVASIPAFAFDTTVEYRVVAIDNANNVASSVLYSYKVTDPYLPLLRIDRPALGSYLSGVVAVTVFMKDQNSGGESGFKEAELSINGTVVKMWEHPAPTEPTTYDWNTTAFGPDGVYIVKLKVSDKADNVVEKSLTVTVDNTSPSAIIGAPIQGSFLSLSTLIRVTGSDANFDKMEVRINDQLIRTFYTKGSEVVEWNTRNYNDGAHSVTLTVYDKAGNQKQANVNVGVDNTPPQIGTPSWSPEEPAADVDIQINATVSEPSFGSGILNVTVWFKNKTMDDWQPIPMQAPLSPSGNWTATLSNQSDTLVEFFITAFDRAGNSAESIQQEFTVAAPSGIPLSWILAAIAVIAGGSGGGYAYARRRRKRGATGSSVPAAFVKSVEPFLPSESTSARKPTKSRVKSELTLQSLRLL